MNPSDHLPVGQRIEVLLHRGEADVWYPGEAIEGSFVVLAELPPGFKDRLVGVSEIADWRLPNEGDAAFRMLTGG